ncbi:MAG: group 1 glycosyl transferase [Parcubacteria group bacterium]|jgi:glycosyltransferase involved in cell wall biosynthesis|nr:group 1 glycosyl transferase [Parcubacteria group bacterium]|tara:strand:+ start:11195 stop:12346 length:1152 start_codon:yes stop_codon:yes gene_type:complete
MKIGIDIRVLARGTRTGVEEYTINLLRHLLKIDPGIEYRLFYNAFQKIELNCDWLGLNNVYLEEFRIPNRLFFTSVRYLNQPKIDKLLKGIDVYFNPHFFTAPLSSKCRKVITFHDLSFEHYPHFFSWRKRAWQKFLMNARKEAQEADKIIAVSQSTKDDLINLYGINPAKIKVVYSGVGSQFKKQKTTCLPARQGNKKQETRIRNKYNLPDKFILYFGTIEPRKNLIGLIKAFELLNTRYKLVIAGTRGWLYQDIFKAVQNSKQKQDIFFIGFIEEEDKPYLYNLAEVFVYPSFFEGFGFPPLEAMASGVPTITSSSSSLPEVVGSAGLMIDPYNIDELAGAMEMVLNDDSLKQRLIKKGIEQAKKFSWQKSAQKTLEVLRE